MLEEKASLRYLGASIYSDGRADSEISRKLGTARADFTQLAAVWKHANVPVKDKLQYFHALIVSRLIYGLSSMWLVVAQRRRLDGFYARCLRSILRIAPSFISWVSNVRVLRQAGVASFSDQLLQRQMIFLGKIARSPADSPLRRDTFSLGTILHQLGRFVGRVGRPRQD